MSYKVTIINNENGDVLIDTHNADAVLGSVCYEGGVAEMGFISCSALTALCGIKAMDAVKENLIENIPQLKLAEKLLNK